jgi:hypothetical protein
MECLSILFLNQVLSNLPYFVECLIAILPFETLWDPLPKEFGVDSIKCDQMSEKKELVLSDCEPPTWLINLVFIENVNCIYCQSDHCLISRRLRGLFIQPLAYSKDVMDCILQFVG